MLNFMGADRVLFFDSRFEIFALQQLLQSDAAIQTDDVFERHGTKPVTVADRFCALGIKNLKRLLAISRRVCAHFLMRQMRPCNGSTARVANHSSKIAENENRLVAEVLKLPQFAQNNRVPKVNIRCRRVHPKLDEQGSVQRKLLAQFAIIDDLRGALFQQRQSFVRLHEPVTAYRTRLSRTSETCFCSTTRAAARSCAARCGGCAAADSCLRS